MKEDTTTGPYPPALDGVVKGLSALGVLQWWARTYKDDLELILRENSILKLVTRSRLLEVDFNGTNSSAFGSTRSGEVADPAYHAEFLSHASFGDIR